MGCGDGTTDGRVSVCRGMPDPLGGSAAAARDGSATVTRSRSLGRTRWKTEASGTIHPWVGRPRIPSTFGPVRDPSSTDPLIVSSLDRSTPTLRWVPGCPTKPRYRGREERPWSVGTPGGPRVETPEDPCEYRSEDPSSLRRSLSTPSSPGLSPVLCSPTYRTVFLPVRNPDSDRLAQDDPKPKAGLQVPLKPRTSPFFTVDLNPSVQW